jgi:hypothetical protein
MLSETARRHLSYLLYRVLRLGCIQIHPCMLSRRRVPGADLLPAYQSYLVHPPTGDNEQR